jgi:hypothetical protein
MENVLEDTNFDVVILGTGLIEAILAGFVFLLDCFILKKSIDGNYRM